MTRQQIENLDTRSLLAIARSTSTTGRYLEQLQWAHDELDRRRKRALSLDPDDYAAMETRLRDDISQTVSDYLNKGLSQSIILDCLSCEMSDLSDTDPKNAG